MPRDPDRIPKVLDRLQTVWEQWPDLRLGQLIYCVTAKHDLFMIEDDKFLKLLAEWQSEYVTQTT